MAAADLVELARLRLDAVGRVDHHDDAVGGDQRAVGVFAEVLVAGRVEQRHAPALNLELERRRRDRDAALLLHLHPVRRRGPAILAAAHGAGQLDGARIEQQLLGERGLAGVRMRNDGKRSPARDLALELACRGVDGSRLKVWRSRNSSVRWPPSLVTMSASPVASRHPRSSAWATIKRSKGSRVQPTATACENQSAAGGSSRSHRASPTELVDTVSRTQPQPAGLDERDLHFHQKDLRVTRIT